MRIQELWNKFTGEDVYICGTGPSIRCFDPRFFEGRLTIGLNQFYRHFDATYSITVHPELFVEWKESHSHQKTKWMVKRKGVLEKLPYDHPSLYVFDTNDGNNPNDTRFLITPTPDRLYQGRGVQLTAMCLAAHMGAKNVFLVGCDMAQIGRDHHGHSQHVRFNGLRPEEVYAEYRRFTAKTRKILKDRFGVRVMTLSPFIGLSSAEEDYNRLMLEMGLPVLPVAKDTSKYKRTKPDM